MTEPTKRVPSAATLATRAFAKVQQKKQALQRARAAYKIERLDGELAAAEAALEEHQL